MIGSSADDWRGRRTGHLCARLLLPGRTSSPARFGREDVRRASALLPRCRDGAGVGWEPGPGLTREACTIDPRQFTGWCREATARWSSPARAAINAHLARWAMRKFRRFRGKYARAMDWLQKHCKYQPDLFARRQLVAFT